MTQVIQRKISNISIPEIGTYFIKNIVRSEQIFPFPKENSKTHTGQVGYTKKRTGKTPSSFYKSILLFEESAQLV